MEIRTLKNVLMKFLHDEEGASGIEYAIIAAMVAVAIVAFVPGISEAIAALFTEIQTELQGASGTGGG